MIRQFTPKPRSKQATSFRPMVQVGLVQPTAACIKAYTFTSIKFASNSTMGKKLAVVFIGIHICGMHHYGRPRFDIGESFHLRREPDNKHDANSIAVLDEGRTVAHINGCDAAKLAPILDSGFAKGTVFYKVKHEAEVKSKKKVLSTAAQ
jgi:hypothetical protein